MRDRILKRAAEGRKEKADPVLWWECALVGIASGIILFVSLIN